MSPSPAKAVDASHLPGHPETASASVSTALGDSQTKTLLLLHGDHQTQMTQMTQVLSTKAASRVAGFQDSVPVFGLGKRDEPRD